MLVKNTVLWQALLITIVLVKISCANSAEIQAFGYLGYEGELNLDYLSENNSVTTEESEIDPDTKLKTGRILSNSTEDRRIVSQANLDLLFHSFIYHPNFLKFDFGIGLIQTQSSVDIAQVDRDVEIPGSRNTNTSTAFDYNLLFSFFEKKDYPFSFFYSKKTPPLTAATTDAFISKNTRYGAKFLWNAPIIINVDAIHFETSGASNLRVIKEEVDSTSFRAYRLNQSNGYQQFSFNHQVSKSESGSVNDNITESLNITDDVNYTGQISFGELEQFDFRLNMNYQQNRKAFEFNDTSIIPEFKWVHSERLKSYYQYAYKVNEFEDYKVETQAILSGLAYTNLEGISNVVNFSASRTELPNASNAQNDIRDSLSYITRFTGGSLSLNALVSVGQNESRSDLEDIPVRIEEYITITREGKNLSYENVVIHDDDHPPPSLPDNHKQYEIVVISKTISGKIYSPDSDYEVINRNGIVTIRRRGSNDLLENEEVRVSYFYFPGRNNVLQTETASLNGQLNFFDYYNVFAGISKFNIDVREGTISSTQVTERDTRYYGAGVDLPIWDDEILVGAEIRREQIKENITSINSTTKLIYSQFRLFRTGSLYLSRRKIESDYIGIEGEDNDINKVTYHVLFKIQPTHRTNLSLIYDESEDIGTIVSRKYTESSLKYEWHYRRLLLNLTASLLKDTQGKQSRERAAIHLNLIRTF